MSSSWKTSLPRNISRIAEVGDAGVAGSDMENGLETSGHGRAMINDYERRSIDVVHRVGIPESKGLVQQFNSQVKETLFPDDPFREFKGKPFGRKVWLGFRYFFPILEWAPNYNLNLLKSDVISGVTIASLAIPQGISYAKLANLPPIHGLCEFRDLEIR